MNDQFADYETSLMLKELGMDQKSMGYFIHDNKDFRLAITKEQYPHTVDAYLWQQVEEWLWAKHRLYLTLHQSGNMFACEIENLEQVMITLKPKDFCDSPAIAKTEGIKQAVKYLHSKLK